MVKNCFKYFAAALVLVGMYLFITLPTSCSLNTDKQDENEEVRDSVETFDNVARANELSEDIFSFICLVEGGIVNEKTGENYHCGARWTTWYGVTTTPDGKFLKKGQRIPKATAKAWAFEHLRKHVYPFLSHFTRKLTDEQIIGVCLFIYNVGGEALTG